MIVVVAAILFATTITTSTAATATAAATDTDTDTAHKSEEAPPPLVEGLKVKFPSVSDITRPIISPLQKVGRDVKAIPRTVTKTAKATTKEVGKRVAAVEKKVSGILRVVDEKITGGFKTAFAALAAAVTFLTNIPGCLIYYLLDALGWAMYAPIAFFVWVFSLQALERALWQYVDIADEWTHRATGVHPFHFSASVRNKCYFANIREPPRAAADTDADDEDGEAAGRQSNDAQLMGTLTFALLCLALAGSAVIAR